MAALLAATLSGCAGGNKRSRSSKPFGSWMHAKQPPKQPKTVAEWLSQPRPGY